MSVSTAGKPPDTATEGEQLPTKQPTQQSIPATQEAEDAEKRRRRSYRWKVVFGLLLPSFLVAVDTTIVAPALPTIASAFSMFNQDIVSTWLATYHTQTSSAVS